MSNGQYQQIRQFERVMDEGGRPMINAQFREIMLTADGDPEGSRRTAEAGHDGGAPLLWQD